MSDLGGAIDALFAAFRAPGSPGAAVAVARHGELLHAAGHGLASLEHGVPIAPDTVFHVASVSKQVLAFEVARLALDGRLDLDTDLRQLLPELAGLPAAVTARQVLAHTSGLRDQWELLVLAGWRMDDVITTTDVLELVGAQRELNFPPGTEHLYGNTGWTLLAVLVERLTDTSLRSLAADATFAPLGMDRTHWHADLREVVAGSASSYSPTRAGGWRRSVLSYHLVGATSLWSTATDLLAWAANLRTGAVGGAELRDLLRRPARLVDGTELPYALGLAVGRHRGAPTVGHSGADAGFRSHVVTYPEHGLDCAVLSNAASCDPAALARRIADLVLADELEPAPRAVPVATSELEALAGLYLDRRSALVHELVADGGLRVEGPVLDGDLRPVAPGRFVPVGSAVELHADGDRLRWPGAPAIDAVRVTATPACPDPALLGAWRSEELDVGWSVEADDDGMVLRRRRYGVERLWQVDEGLYRGWVSRHHPVGASLEVAGDELLVTTGRCRRLRFRRR